jgi:hypothetical protein
MMTLPKCLLLRGCKLFAPPPPSRHHMYPYIPRVSLFLFCKRATNYDASLVFQDVVVKSTIFLFPSPQFPCPPMPTSASAPFPVLIFGGREGRGRVGMSK